MGVHLLMIFYIVNAYVCVSVYVRNKALFKFYAVMKRPKNE